MAVCEGDRLRLQHPKAVLLWVGIDSSRCCYNGMGGLWPWFDIRWYHHSRDIPLRNYWTEHSRKNVRLNSLTSIVDCFFPVALIFCYLFNFFRFFFFVTLLNLTWKLRPPWNWSKFNWLAWFGNFIPPVKGAVSDSHVLSLTEEEETGKSGPSGPGGRGANRRN